MAVHSERPGPGSDQYPGAEETAALSRIVASVVDPDATLLQVVGTLNPGLAADLDAAIDRVAPEHSILVVGLDECGWIDSAGIGVLDSTRARLADTGRALYLCAPQEQPLLALQVNGLAGSGLLIDSLEDVLG